MSPGIRDDLVARRFRVPAIGGRNIRRARMRLVRAAESREVLPEALTRGGVRFDVVAAYRTVEIGEVYNIGSGEARVNLEVARGILALTGRSESLILHVKDRPGHDRRYALDSAKIHRQLAWAPAVPFRDGLRQTVEWYHAYAAWWQEILSGDYRTYYERQYGEGIQGIPE